jgi:hypothetical protein
MVLSPVPGITPRLVVGGLAVVSSRAFRPVAIVARAIFRMTEFFTGHDNLDKVISAVWIRNAVSNDTKRIGLVLWDCFASRPHGAAVFSGIFPDCHAVNHRCDVSFIVEYLFHFVSPVVCWFVLTVE